MFTRQEGLVEGSGEFLVITSDHDPEVDWLLAGGHRNEVVCELAHEEPSNPQIIATLHSGVPVTRVRKGTPVDVMKWFKESANKQNAIQGLATTCLEVWEKTDDVETAYSCDDVICDRYNNRYKCVQAFRKLMMLKTVVFNAWDR